MDLSNLFNPSQLYSSLANSNMLPAWQQRLPYSEDVMGEYLPSSNVLTANIPNNDLRRNTVAHEMTHAVQNNLISPMASLIAERKWNQEKVSDQEEQFLKTASTLMNQSYGRVGQYNRGQVEADEASLANMFKASNYKGKDTGYRGSAKEAQAFGVGNTSGEGRANYSIPHLDPTMATEFSILMSMYDKLPQNLRDQAGAGRRASIKTDYENNNGIRQYANPFNFK